VRKLFARFYAHLKGTGCLTMGGQIIDASIVAAPCQRMTEGERAIVKGGGVPENWQAKPAKLVQKGLDACRTLKRGSAAASAAGWRWRRPMRRRRSKSPPSRRSPRSLEPVAFGGSLPGKLSAPYWRTRCGAISPSLASSRRRVCASFRL